MPKCENFARSDFPDFYTIKSLHVGDFGVKIKKNFKNILLLVNFLLLKVALKVPKREIFDRSDFPDFYTIKSLRVGDFGVKIKKI